MYKKIVLVPLMLLPLSGCVPVVLVAAGAGAGTAAIAQDSRSFSVIKQDAAATKTAQSTILHDPELKNHSHINVAVYNHVALMVGQAQTPELRNQAYRIVSSVPNISRVYNQVKVSGSTSLVERSNDAWITSKVKSTFLTTNRLRSDRIKVVTENGVVYLMGLVSQDQAELATNTARRVDGVREVVKVFQYQ
jgi:osmotically-inducible protein OsmY